MSCNIHPTAIIDSRARLGADVTVGAYSIIGPNVQIGDRSAIGPHAVIQENATLGEENVVFQFASIGAPPQDLKYRGEPSTIVIGNRNQIRECVTLHRGTAAGTMTTVIGDDNLFMACCHVAHDCVVGNKNVFANSVAIAGHVTIGDSVILGGMVGVHQFCRVGDLAILGAGAMAPHDILPYCIGQGDRCHLRGVNLVGLRRAGFSAEQISDIKKLYHHLFGSIGDLKEKVKQVPTELAERPHLKRMLDFIGGTKRAICTPLKGRTGSDNDE